MYLLHNILSGVLWIFVDKGQYKFKDFSTGKGGNKIDLVENRSVSKEQGELLAKQYGIGFYETSAKQNLGLMEAFEDVIE